MQMIEVGNHFETHKPDIPQLYNSFGSFSHTALEKVFVSINSSGQYTKLYLLVCRMCSSIIKAQYGVLRLEISPLSHQLSSKPLLDSATLDPEPTSKLNPRNVQPNT